MGIKFYAYKDNSSFNTPYDTYKECMDDIYYNKWHGYYPEIGWQSACGDYDTNWSSLMLVVEKIESLLLAVIIEKSSCYITWQGSEPVDTELLIFLQNFKDIYHNEETKIEAVYLASILFIESYTQLTNRPTA